MKGTILTSMEMPNLTLENVTRACEGIYVGNEELLQSVITGAVIDSRQVEEGYLFIPIRGEKVDGHRFIPDVFAKGALAVLSEVELEHPDGPYILVDSCAVAMKRLAGFYRQSLGLKVVGISGSVGKTSTKEMIASVLEQRFSVLKTAGNYNNEIGLPLTVFRIRSNHQVAVLEMGISDFGEMERLSAIANPDIEVITNIGYCHLEYLGDRDGVLKAKTEMFAHLREGGVAILNGDDDKLVSKTRVGTRESIFYGVGEACETDNHVKKSVYATNVINLGFDGMRARIHTPKGDFDAQIAIPGEHNVHNALAATAVALELGLSIEEIAAGIAAARTIAGRTNFLKVNGMTVIDDCYNANPVSMKTSIEILSHAAGRSIAVLGDMGELGIAERELHREVGTVVGESGIHTLFCAGSLAKEYASAAKESNPNCKVFYYETREAMTEELLKYIKEGDSILVKASHFMEFPEVVKALTGED